MCDNFFPEFPLKNMPRLKINERVAGVLQSQGEIGQDGTMKYTTTEGVKPVLNWANVCSPNILRTLRRTMIRSFPN